MGFTGSDIGEPEVVVFFTGSVARDSSVLTFVLPLCSGNMSK